MDLTKHSYDYKIEDRVYTVTINSISNNDLNSQGYFIATHFNNILIGAYQFLKNVASYEFFGNDESELLNHLFNYNKGFIDGWDKYKRINFEI